MTTIAASNVSVTTITQDTTGDLVMTATSGLIVASGTTGAINMPSGTTTQRPTAVNGMIRYNTTTLRLECYANSTWTNIA